ncbi:MAG: MFS transporter, partial [Caulobacteraceae bacterium]
DDHDPDADVGGARRVVGVLPAVSRLPITTTMTDAASQPIAGRSRAALYTLMSVMFINIMGFGIVVPLLPFYAESFHANAWQIGLIFSAYSLGSFVGEPFWGRLSDRIGRKPVLIFTTLANCACYGALAFAPSIAWAFGIRLLGGMAAGNGSVVQGYIADISAVEERAGRMARLGAAYNIGFILGPFVGGVLAKTSVGPIGFQIPLLAASACGAASSLGVFLALRESRARRLSAEPQRSRWAMFDIAARHPVIGRLILLTFVAGVAFTGIESTFGLWAQHRFNWAPRDVGLCFGLSGLVSAVTNFLLTGPLSRRFGEARVLAVGMIGTAATLALQPLTGGGWATYALLAANSAFSSVAFPNIGAMMSGAAGEDEQGQILGLNNAAGAFARFVGPQLAGWMFAAVSIEGPWLAGAVIVAPAALLALAAGRAGRREDPSLA